jgi:hypothetical protein
MFSGDIMAIGYQGTMGIIIERGKKGGSPAQYRLTSILNQDSKKTLLTK